MPEAWETLARNYARFDTPLRPNAETLAAIRSVMPRQDIQIAVLGSTPLFAELSERVCFIDASASALQLVPPAAQRCFIHKNWLEADDELRQAELIVGDGSLNALDSQQAAAQLLRLLARARKPGAMLVQRIFIQHELPATALHEQLTAALAGERYSEARFLVYGAVAGADGVTPIAAVDNYLAELDSKLPLERERAAAYRDSYFAWRGMTPAEAAGIDARAFIPTRRQLEDMFQAAGLRAKAVSAGNFALAQYTPLFVVTD